MNGLILFSHGSLLCGSDQTLLDHVNQIRSHGSFDHVAPGFMNYSSPTFDDAVSETVALGIKRIVVVPYFLVPGKFVRVDLPKYIASSRAQYPDVEFIVADSIGADSRLANILEELGASGDTSENWGCHADHASKYCSDRSDCPLRSTALCPVSGIVADQGLAVSPSKPNSKDPKPALLIMVHGSPRETANIPMFEVVEQLRGGSKTTIVEPGFMECNQPDIPTAIANCVQQGATEITAVPYFLHTGNHVANDLPELLREAQTQYPEVLFKLSNYLGTSPHITDILLDRAAEAISRFEAAE